MPSPLLIKFQTDLKIFKRFPFDKLPTADLTDKIHLLTVPLGHFFTARINRFGHTGDLKSLVGGIVNIHMQFALGDGKFLVRIKDHNIGILAHGNFPFVLKPEHASRAGFSRVIRPFATPSE